MVVLRANLEAVEKPNKEIVNFKLKPRTSQSAELVGHHSTAQYLNHKIAPTSKSILDSLMAMFPIMFYNPTLPEYGPS
jgi:hypothetical protein